MILSNWMNLHLLAAFEIPASQNWELPEILEEVFPAQGQRFQKNYFRCLPELYIAGANKEWQVNQIAVSGVETDVCIL